MIKLIFQHIPNLILIYFEGNQFVYKKTTTKNKLNCGYIQYFLVLFLDH